MKSFILALMLIAFSKAIWASQEAIVIADQAVIYADMEMTSPIGFVRRGKKIKVGEIPRNRAQVYPIVVSGKVAYIKVLDVSTEKESVDARYLMAERFQGRTRQQHQSNYSVSTFMYSSEMDADVEEGVETAFNWTGMSVRGGIAINKRWDMDVLINFLGAKSEDVIFRTAELGLGASYRVYEKDRFTARLFGQFLFVPWASYAVDEDFRINGYGFSTGAGVHGSYRFGDHWGMEVYGGLFYTKLTGFDAPDPYEDISPSFTGTRLGIGFNYQF